MTLKIRRAVTRLLTGTVVTATVALVIFIVAIATPAEYRIGVWGKWPVLDHRLLPHLSAVIAGAFGAFLDRCPRST